MEIRTVNINQLNPAYYNPRKDLNPSDTEYQKLELSITEFGYIEPIVWNEATGNVISGNQRLKILVDKGINEVEVSVVNLPLDKEKALNIALNKIRGAWDESKLAELLDELIADDVNMALTGFDDAELEKIIDRFGIPDKEFQEYDESIEKEVKKVVCPHCGKEFPL